MIALRYLWAFFPNTLLGLLLVALTRLTGGRVAIVRGVVEAHGGAAAWLLTHATLLPGGASAITFGHVVLGRTPAALDVTREHERVHVRQYERWGPLFLPAYGLSSLLVWRRGGDAYRDNRFEAEAFRLVPPARPGAQVSGVSRSAGDDDRATISRMSHPNPGGQHATQPTFGDPVTKTGNSRLWLPVLVVMLAFLIGAAILVLSGALGGALTDETTPGGQDVTATSPDSAAPGTP